LKSGSLNLLEPSGPVRVRSGSVSLLYAYVSLYIEIASF
jgi:hypothetical protein